MLHVTNGTSVSLAETGLGGEVLAWRDVLHEGPVPGGLDAAELRRVRAIFLDHESPPGGESAADGLARRDQALLDADDVVLWFEHDLYDQLQLIQILDLLRASRARLSLICTNRYLGMLTPAELTGLWPARREVTPRQLDLAAGAWRAFRSPDPMDVDALLRRDLAALPFLAGALRRHLQQFPSVENGLARTERQLLEALAAGPLVFEKLFVAERATEESIFLGDSTLMRYLRTMAECRAPLVRASEGVYYLTDAGREVLSHRADHVRLNGINRWLGGVHLMGHQPLWRWDESAGKLRRT